MKFSKNIMLHGEKKTQNVYIFRKFFLVSNEIFVWNEFCIVKFYVNYSNLSVFSYCFEVLQRYEQDCNDLEKIEYLVKPIMSILSKVNCKKRNNIQHSFIRKFTNTVESVSFNWFPLPNLISISFFLSKILSEFIAQLLMI